jgi:hypothetical protein
MGERMATPAEAVLSRWWWAKFWVKRNSKKLAAAAVASALLIWWLAPQGPPPEWPRVRGPVILETSRRGYLAIPPWERSGVERIYLAPTGRYDPNRDLAGQDVLGVIERSGQEIRIPPRVLFDIVVVVRAFDPDYIGYAAKENLRVAIRASGSFSIPLEPPDDSQEHVIENENYGTTEGFIRMNVVWDNYGQGYELPPYGRLRIEELVLYPWKIGS